MARTRTLALRWGTLTSRVFFRRRSRMRSNRPFERRNTHLQRGRVVERLMYFYRTDLLFSINSGMDWSLVTFTDQSAVSAHLLLDAAASLSVPVKHIDLRNEKHAHIIWERDIVLVHPDDHVAWRADAVGSTAEALDVWRLVIGLEGESKVR
jgi:hypothetical protein